MNSKTQHHRKQKSVILVLIAFVVFICGLFFATTNFPTVASADEISELKGEIKAQKEELDSIMGKLKEAKQNQELLQGQIDKQLLNIEAAQQKQQELNENLSEYAKSYYKMGDLDVFYAVLQADTLKGMLATLWDFLYCQDDAVRKIKQQKELVDTINLEIEQITKTKDEQDKIVEESDTLKQEAQQKLKKLRNELSKKQVQEYGGAIETFDSGDTSGWRSGPASAYGGYGDAQISSNMRTATGAAVTESSMGVAVPMAWGNVRRYYGKKIEISYNGKSVIATVNDCGGMNGGQRHLDLQPGVFKAFGASNCNSWGVRTVKYRFLD